MKKKQELIINIDEGYTLADIIMQAHDLGIKDFSTIRFNMELDYGGCYYEGDIPSIFGYFKIIL